MPKAANAFGKEAQGKDRVEAQMILNHKDAIEFLVDNADEIADVPKDLYVQATLGVYELNKVELLRGIYLWAYERSADRYAAVRQSLGEPDPFRLKHRDALRQVVGTVVRDQFDRSAAIKYLETWTAEHLAQEERDEFQRVAEDEILALHEGNFARYKVRPSEFAEWRKIWDRK